MSAYVLLQKDKDVSLVSSYKGPADLETIGDAILRLREDGKWIVWLLFKFIFLCVTST